MNGGQRTCLFSGAIVVGLLVLGLGVLLPVSAAPRRIRYETALIADAPRPAWSNTTEIDATGAFYVYDGVQTASCSAALLDDSHDRVTQAPAYRDLGRLESDPCVPAKQTRRDWLRALVAMTILVTIGAVVVLGRKRRNTSGHAPTEMAVTTP